MANVPPPGLVSANAKLATPRLLTALVAIALLVAACGSSASPTPSASLAAPTTTRSPSPSASPSASPSPTPSPSASPTVDPATILGNERLNVLLVGIDNTQERRASALTDSMIVASLDPVAGRVSLLGLPRDLTDFPLPNGSTYRQKLNSLMSAIRSNPGRFGGTSGQEPYEVLAGVIGNLVDLPIDHWAVIDMDGFAGMVDALGGIDVYVEKTICDAGYRQLGVRGFEAAAGWWHVTGPQALALARVRHDAGGSDFQRLRRQLDMLVPVREAILANGAEGDPLGWLAKVPQLKTDLSPELILGAAALMARIPADRFHSRLVQPFGSGGTEVYDSRGYALSANMAEIDEIAELLFPAPGSRVRTGASEAPAKPAEVKALPRFNGC